MFIGNASNLINAAKQAADGNDTADYLLKNLVCGAEFYKEHINSVPSEEAYHEVARYVEEIAGISFGVEDAKMLLSLYGKARIKVAEYGLSDTDVRDDVSFAVSHFFMGCGWPTYGDNVNIDDFLSLLKSQANKLDYSTL